MIKAVVLDIGGVLERVDDASWPLVWAARWELRAGREPGALAAGLTEHQPAGSVVKGEVTEQQLRAACARTLDLDEPSADAMMAELWDAYCGVLDAELHRWFAGLRGRYRLGLLSNSADGARREESRRFGLPDLVDDLVYSHEVGLAKPDARIYALAARRLQVDPEEIVFLDDSDVNVAAARTAGWHAVLHEDAATSIARVEAILRAEGSAR